MKNKLCCLKAYYGHDKDIQQYIEILIPISNNKIILYHGVGGGKYKINNVRNISKLIY